ncbi:uncharacterized protein LOC131906578 isoform X2 [Peromyscus eremicus]|nr:uncharacterized protein LOC131906578 isoform X2 [Peromyscus eremicus]XP_059113171.1 uncharacterized protein LOC131906578 isoform X2 [Peromyscus eremicus]XP_059113172.1 uncharacterized protein LOC131906578 isoform X2 [Peromyscus eremicus]
MNDLRNSTFVAVGPSDYTDYLDINKAVQELQSPHMPGLFILKPKDPPKYQSTRSSAGMAAGGDQPRGAAPWHNQHWCCSDSDTPPNTEDLLTAAACRLFPHPARPRDHERVRPSPPPLDPHTATAMILHHNSERTVRRIYSFINWIIRWAPDYVHLDTPAPNTGHLFGQMLMDICEDGVELPAPIMAECTFSEVLGIKSFRLHSISYFICF